MKDVSALTAHFSAQSIFMAARRALFERHAEWLRKCSRRKGIAAVRANLSRETIFVSTVRTLFMSSIERVGHVSRFLILIR